MIMTFFRTRGTHCISLHRFQARSSSFPSSLRLTTDTVVRLSLSFDAIPFCCRCRAIWRNERGTQSINSVPTASAISWTSAIFTGRLAGKCSAHAASYGTCIMIRFHPGVRRGCNPSKSHQADDENDRNTTMPTPSCPIRPSRPSSRSPAALTLLVCFLATAMGVVTPFAGADVGSSIRHPTLTQQQQQCQQQKQRSTRPGGPSPLVQSPRYPSSSSTGTTSSTALQNALPVETSSSTSTSSAPPTTQRRTSHTIRSFLSQLNPMPGRKDGRWKGGESKAKLASQWLFSYVNPLLDVTTHRTLTEQDAFEVAESRTMSHASVDALTDTYNRARHRAQQNLAQKQRRKAIAVERRENDHDERKNKEKFSRTLVLLSALVRSQGTNLFFTGFMRLLNTGIQAFPAILVARLLRAIEAGPAQPVNEALKTALLLVGVLSVKLVVENQLFHNVVNMSTQVRGSLEGMIFDKSLRLPDGGSGVMTKKDTSKDKTEREALGSGGVLNLMQSDASMIESVAMQVHTIWDGPLQIAMYMKLLFDVLGPSVWWGLVVMLMVIPMNSITLRYLDRLSREENEAKRNRTKRTNESIAHMKLLKVQAWEKVFAKDVEGHRDSELNRHKRRGVVRAINSAISNSVPSLVLVVTLAAYAKTGKPVLASTVFTAISLFNQLRFPLFFYPAVIDSLASGKNALRRISSYLTSEEVIPYVKYLPPIEGGKIEMKNGSFLWSTSQEPKEGEVSPPESPALCDVNLQVNPGEVVAVVGGVGSGKSALVKGLLGELAPVPRILVEDKPDISNSTQTDQMMTRPEVTMHGHVGYCGQQAWLPKGSLRDSVVFGRHFNEARYESALYDAGLDQDIASGALSSEMDVGEKGGNLSGGQRARVALARALYGDEDTKVYILDDCLAALDVRVGSLVFERITRRFKKAKAATIFVTNDPSLPRRCDRVILMGPTGGGASSSPFKTCSTIIDSGTYDRLLLRGHKLQSFPSIDRDSGKSNDHEESSKHDIGGEFKVEAKENRADTIRVVGGYRVMTNDTDCSCHADPDTLQVEVQNNADLIAERVILQDQDAMDSLEVVEEMTIESAGATRTNSTSFAASSPSSEKRSAVGLVSMDEQMTTQAVPISTYTGYIRAVRCPPLIIAMLASFGISNGAQFFQQYTVSKWTEVAATSTAAAMGGRYLSDLVKAAGVVSAFLWFRSFFTMLVGLRASSFYHKRMLSSVFRAPMSFFDATPSGQILSRFGKELETVDRGLPDTITSVLFCVLQIVSSAAALAGAITPAMMVPLTFAGSLYLRIMRQFRPAARDMKRSEQRTRSPIFTNFGEALRGTEVIRSIPGATRTWSAKHRQLSDTNLAVFSTVKALDRWLSVNLEAIGNLMVFITALASIFLTRAGKLQAGFAGWGLTQSLSITGLMAWAIRNLTTLESNMMSVMRVSELTDIDNESSGPKVEGTGTTKGHKNRMPKEMEQAGEALAENFPQSLDVSIAPVNEEALLADGWPWKGGLTFNNVSMRYNAASPLVLKGVTLSVPPGSTLGVVGRTGSGKSSLLLTLFRIIEIEGGGSIKIDGVDIRSVSMETLRDSLAIIPQEATLFAGTLAFNLDAKGQASPKEMWAALEAASPDLVRQFQATGGLESEISEGGGNLSQGQRQLICLARALLRKSKILVLDEATSSVDAQTDQQVQDTIQKQFVDKGVSVITVAHRLDTVLGNDKIAVLGDGELLEYGSPSELLKIRNGELRSLVEADRSNKRKGGERATTTSSEAVAV